MGDPEQSDTPDYLKLYRLNDKKQFIDMKLEKEILPFSMDASEETAAEFAVLDDGTLLVLYDSGKMTRYDLDTQNKLNEFTCNSLKINNLCGNRFYSMNMEIDKILINDVKTGELIQEVDFKIEDEDRQVNFCLDEEKNLYIASRDGIFYLESGSEKPECLLPASKQAIFAVNERENVCIGGISKKGNNLYAHYFIVDESDMSGGGEYKHWQKIYEYHIEN